MGLMPDNLAGNAYPLWQKLSSRSGGKWLFSRLMGLGVPYSGNLRAGVEELQPGFARVVLKDRRRIRNHLRCIHAIALANLGELVSGIALMAALPEDKRGIVIALSIDYFKKARGTLVAESRSLLPVIDGPTDHTVQAEIQDDSGDLVAKVTVQWRLDTRQ